MWLGRILGPVSSFLIRHFLYLCTICTWRTAFPIPACLTVHGNLFSPFLLADSLLLPVSSLPQAPPSPPCIVNGPFCAEFACVRMLGGGYSQADHFTWLVCPPASAPPSPPRTVNGPFCADFACVRVLGGGCSLGDHFTWLVCPPAPPSPPRTVNGPFNFVLILPV